MDCKAIPALLALVSLTGCGATQAQQRISTIGTEMPQVSAENRACREAVYAKPEHGRFSSRLPMDAEKPTPEQLSDPTRVVLSDRQPLTSFFGELNQCRDAFTHKLARALPEMVPLREESAALTDAMRARLLVGEATWGDTNIRALTLSAEHRAKWLAGVQSVNAGLAASHAAEMNDRAATAAIFAGALGAAAGAAAAPRYYVPARPVVVNNFYRR
jgi:hypothetical protein